MIPHTFVQRIPLISLCPQVAGSDTTKWALSYVVYEVFRDAELKRRVQAELDHAMPDGDVCISYETVNTLPNLLAICKEVLRYWAPIPGTIFPSPTSFLAK